MTGWKNTAIFVKMSKIYSQSAEKLYHSSDIYPEGRFTLLLSLKLRVQKTTESLIQEYFGVREPELLYTASDVRL